MVAMGVGDENMRHCFVAHGIEQRTDMRGIVRAWIHNRHFAAADDVTDCTFERERSRIVSHDPPYARNRLVRQVGRELEILVERNVIVHDARIHRDQGLYRPFTPPLPDYLKTWMPGTRPGMAPCLVQRRQNFNESRARGS